MAVRIHVLHFFTQGEVVSALLLPHCSTPSRVSLAVVPIGQVGACPLLLCERASW